MVRTQIYLPGDVHTQLTKLATLRNEPMAQVVREFVEDGLKRKQPKLLGNASILVEFAQMAEKGDWSGATDLAQNHDKYLAEALGQDLERIHKQYDNTR